MALAADISADIDGMVAINHVVLLPTRCGVAA
jgi:hypothetical protein